MASLYVSWIGDVTNGIGSSPMGSEVVTTSGTSAQSGANPAGEAVQLFSDAAHYVAVGDNPTATAGNGIYVPANQAFYLAIGNGKKIAAITV